MMKKTFSLRNLYLYLSSFAALLFFLFGTVFTIGNLVELTGVGLNFQTYNNYRTTYDKTSNQEILKEDTPELRAAYEEEKSFSAAQEKQRHLEGVAYSLSSSILGLFFWLFFWKQAKKEN